MANKAKRVAAEEAARIAAEEAEKEKQAEESAGNSDDSCEVLMEPHPTNPFLAVSGDVLIPTTASVNNKPKREQNFDNQDLVNDFDVNNSNPFDGAELQSLSNFDALKSVLAPEVTHDFSFLDGTGPARPESSSPVYTEVQFVKKTNSEPVVSPPTPPEPEYSAVNKPPAVIKSNKLDQQTSIPISNNGPQIHSTFTAVKSTSGFDMSPPRYDAEPPPQYSPPAYSPAPPAPKPAYSPPAPRPSYSPPAPTPSYSPPAPEPSCSPFPRIPEEIVARAMQRLQDNQEECFLFLQEVLEVMTKYDCSAEVAEAASLLEEPGKKREDRIVLIKQFSELGFSVQDIVTGLKKEPDDRDALLDFLVSNS